MCIDNRAKEYGMKYYTAVLELMQLTGVPDIKPPRWKTILPKHEYKCSRTKFTVDVPPKTDRHVDTMYYL